MRGYQPRGVPLAGRTKKAAPGVAQRLDLGFSTKPCNFRSFPSVKHVTYSAQIYRLNTSPIRPDLSVKHVTYVHIVRIK